MPLGLFGVREVLPENIVRILSWLFYFTGNCFPAKCVFYSSKMLVRS